MYQYKELKRLLKTHKAQLFALETRCRHTDGTKGYVSRATELNYRKDFPAFFLAYEGEELVGFLSLFLPGPKDAELNALVHPAHRQQGIFRELLSRAQHHLSAAGIRGQLFVCEPQALASTAAMKALGSVLASSEYQMTLSNGFPSGSSPKENKTNTPADAFTSSHRTPRLVLAEIQDLPALARLDALFFDSDPEASLHWVEQSFHAHNLSLYKYIFTESGTILGMASLCTESASCTIFGLGIDPEYRGYGYGKALLMDLLAEIPKNLRISLQVSSQNAVAFCMYQKAGFAVTAQQDYWRISS